jgi:hypothetical protein
VAIGADALLRPCTSSGPTIGWVSDPWILQTADEAARFEYTGAPEHTIEIDEVDPDRLTVRLCDSGATTVMTRRQYRDWLDDYQP